MKTTTNNNGVSAANNSNNWKNEVNEIRARLEAIKPRSCWDRGVKGFALDLLESYENICEYCESDGQPVPELNEETLLNGAADWNAYCYGGCALIYDGDIAKVLCTPSELKRTDNGNKAPNDREGWQDVQARAYFQAFRLLTKDAAMKTKHTREYINVHKAKNWPLFYDYCKAAGLITPKDLEYYNFEYFNAVNYMGGEFKIDGKQGYFTDRVCIERRAVVFYLYTWDDDSEAAALAMLRDFFEYPQAFDHSAALQNWSAWEAIQKGVAFRRGDNWSYYRY